LSGVGPAILITNDVESKQQAVGNKNVRERLEKEYKIKFKNKDSR
jgi:hypothetical protein